MIANYHTHTPRCNHAVGEEAEYVRAAIDSGLQILGFSDHAPQFFPGTYYSRMRMRPEQLDDYVQTVRRLQKAYAGQLQILLGMEVEYYPGIFEHLLEVLRDAGIEYMILGQHWNGNEEGYPYNGKPSDDEHKLALYCDQVIAAIETGYFTYIAHPDLLHFTGSDRIYERHMRRLCKAAKSCNIPLEINLLGLREERHYPNSVFWQLAAEENCSVVLGCDAHDPQHTLQPQIEATALEIVKTNGLTLLETVALQHF